MNSTEADKTGWPANIVGCNHSPIQSQDSVKQFKIKTKASFCSRDFSLEPKPRKKNNIPNIGLIVAPSVQESRGMVERKHFG